MLTNNQRDLVAFMTLVVSWVSYGEGKAKTIENMIERYKFVRDKVEEIDTLMENEDALDRSE